MKLLDHGLKKWTSNAGGLILILSAKKGYHKYSIHQLKAEHENAY